ncbi:MAG: cation:proton antiporter [Rubrobacteraceae bacterium]
MAHIETSFIPLMVVISLAFLVPILLSRIKGLFIPIVVGELVAGMIVGRSGLGIVPEDHPILGILAPLGFAFLMFLSGLEIDLGSFTVSGDENASRVRQVFTSPLGTGVTLMVLVLAASIAAGLIFWSQGLVRDPWIMALILSTTSLGVVMPVLKEQGFTGGSYGQTIIVSAMIADFSTILLISAYSIFYRQGLSIDLVLVLALIAAFLVVYSITTAFKRISSVERLFRQLSSATAQLGLKGAFALAILFMALAQGLGIEYILGSFLAGVIVSALSSGEGSALQEKLDGIGYGFFVPIFFIMVGVGFDLPALLSSGRALLLVPILIGVAYAVKLVPILIFRLQFSWRETIGAGVLMSARLSLIIAAAAIGLDLGVITEAVNSAVILVAVITCTISPILFGWIAPEQEERERIIVIGPRSSAELLVRRLRDHEFDTVLIPAKEINGMSERGPEEVYKDVLEEAGAEKAHTVVAMRHSDKENLRLCRIAHNQYGVENVISWVQNPALNDDFRKCGARVTNPAYSAVLSIESMVLSPGTFSMTADVDEMQEVREVRVTNSGLHGRTLDKISLPGDVLVFMIERDGGVLVPDHVPGHDIALREDDIVTLAGSAEEIDAAVKYFK